MSYQWKVGELALCVEGYYQYLTAGMIYVITAIWKDGDIAPDGIRRSGYGISLLGVPDVTPRSPMTYAWRPSRFRPLNDSDIQRITEKHKDSLPKRSLVNDDAEAIKRIEELTGIKLSPPWSGDMPFIFDPSKQEWVRGSWK